jgi:hypothetical protein
MELTGLQILVIVAVIAAAVDLAIYRLAAHRDGRSLRLFRSHATR